MSKKEKKESKEKNMAKIYALKKALEDIGIYTELWTDAEWFCVDNKVHIGIELHTDMDYGEDCWSFIFTPNGEYITYCTQAPVREE